MNRDKSKAIANPEKMFNESDLLFINDFVQEEIKDIPPEKAENYKQHYQKNGKVSQSAPQSAQDVPQQIEQGVSSLLVDRKSQLNLPEADFRKGPVERNVNIRRIRRSRKIYIDSKNRDKLLYPDASDMKVSWGRTFTNVVSMRLNSMEFSNVAKVVNLNSNKLYWINQEDEDLPDPYPVYKAELLTGSYTFTALQSEAVTRTNLIRRHNGERTSDGLVAPYHVYNMEINEETDYVNFASIVNKAVPTNPITTVSGDTLVIFQFPSHGFEDQERVHISGVRGVLGGVRSVAFNNAFTITKINDDSFSFDLTSTFSSDVTGGGALVEAGKESPYKFLFGTYSDTIADLIGFRLEDSSDTIPITDPITSVSIPVSNVIPGNVTQIIAIDHGLSPGDIIYLNNFHVSPSVYNNERHKGIFQIFTTPSPDIITIRYYTQSITDISNAFIGSKLFRMNFPGHGFNKIVDIQQIASNVISITTLFPHGLETGYSIRIKNTNSAPSVDGYYRDIQVIDLDTFTISNPLNILSPEILPLTITSPGFRGSLLADLKFRLYNVTKFGGFTEDELNNKEFEIRDTIDQDNFTFSGTYGYSTISESGGGSDIRISSLLHGWNGNHDNSPNGVLNQPVKLSGDNYAFMCIKNIVSDTVSSNGPVKDIFAKLFITSNPGIIIFNQFDPSEIEFINPIPQLDELHFQIRSPDNTITSFGGLDYSFGLEIIEEIEIDDSNQIFGSRVLLD
jgi:hypothetical protein